MPGRLSACIAIAVVHFGSVAAADTLRPIDITLGEWRPVISSEIDGYGEPAELVTVILKRMGYRPNYIFMPWGNAEASVRANEKNEGPRASLPYLKSEKRYPTGKAERERPFLFSEQPVFTACMVFFYNLGKIPGGETVKLETLNRLSDFRIGYVRPGGGFQYPDELTAILETNGTQYSNLYDVFAELVDAENPLVQIVPAVEAVGREILTELLPARRFSVDVLRESPPSNDDGCLLKVDYFFIMSNRNPHNVEFMGRFNDTYARIRQTDSETIARIRQRAKERPTKSRPAVVLKVAGESDRITAQTQAGERIIVPRATPGLLHRWQSDRSATDPQAEILITAGPYRGLTLLVDRKFVALDREVRE